jgi:hypothetical protein
LLLLAGWCPTVEKQEAGVDGLGIAVIPISILIFEVCSKIIELLTMGAADHQRCKIFLADGADSECTFGVGGHGGIYDGSSGCHLFDLGSQERRNNPDNSESSICLEGLNMRQEFAMVGMIINSISLVISKQTLVGRDGCHDTLHLCVIGAAETLDKF